MNEKLGFLSLLGSAFLFSLLGAVVRFLSGYFGDSSQAAIRDMITLLILGVVMLLMRKSFRLPWKHLNKVAFVGYCVTSATSSLFFIVSVMQIKAANAVFYLYTASFIASFTVDLFVRKEKTTVIKMMSLGLAFCGLLIFSYPIGEVLSVGVLFGLLTGLSDTLHFTSQDYLKKDIANSTLLFYSYMIGGVLLVIWAIFSGEHLLKVVDWNTILVVLALGVLNVSLSGALLYGFNNFQLNKGTIVVSGELPFALVVNYLLLHESPSVLELAGAVFMFLAIFISNIYLARRSTTVELV